MSVMDAVRSNYRRLPGMHPANHYRSFASWVSYVYLTNHSRCVQALDRTGSFGGALTR